MRKVFRVLGKVVFSRTIFIILMLILQIGVMVSGILWLGQYISFLWAFLTLLGVAVLFYLVNKEDLPEFKIAWLIPVCVFPIFGALLYVYVERNWGSRTMKKMLNQVISDTGSYMRTESGVRERLAAQNVHMGSLSAYLEETGGYPTYAGGEAVYFPVGEEKWKDMLQELRAAKEFIFLEYFIVEPGVMWDSILDILKEKVAEGVEVRFMYDGMCSLMLLPYNYPEKMEAFGIRTKAFSPIIPMLSTHQNNRDHRKILVVDGRVAYTGGVNLADEYVNKKQRFGHWKDTAVKITGKAVDSFTMMFLRTWDVGKKRTEEMAASDYEKYLHKYDSDFGEGFMIPYGDGPNRKENVAEKVYIDILNTAVGYVHIMTPYFIVDSAMLQAIQFAARRGVEVKLLLPHIPDKAYAFAIARTYYPALLEAGVRLYEYTPGFVHAKCFVSDDCKAVVGTINLDYRSLYHHFECAAYFYRCPVVADVERDFQNTTAVSEEITMETYRKLNPLWKVAGHVMNLFGPLM
ncbi:MAG: cardiolipin synthase [Lachnospiraceae bacterium]|nr:cardiolipin synthase [Lachnospiraceae bacterium]